MSRLGLAFGLCLAVESFLATEGPEGIGLAGLLLYEGVRVLAFNGVEGIEDVGYDASTCSTK